MVARLAPPMVHRDTRSQAAQDRRAERGILHCKEESYQVSCVKLLERSEINALSHGYSGADCRGNERNAETDRGAGRPVGGGTPAWRKPRQSGTGVGQVDGATSTTASRKVGGHKGNRPPVKLRAAARKRAWRRASQCGRGRCRTTSSVYSQIFGDRSSGQQ